MFSKEKIAKGTFVIAGMLIFGLWEGYGCWRMNTGGTHRDWIAQFLYGLIFAVCSGVISVPLFFIVKNKKNLIWISASCIAIGLAPVAVRFLWKDCCDDFFSPLFRLVPAK